MSFNFSIVSDSCVKCAKCVPDCTIHKEISDETTSPRGFLDLLGAYQRGELELDKNAKKIFESCFLCTNCVEVCPNSLPVDMMIENIRYKIAQKFGIAWWKRAFFFLLRNRKMMDLVAKFGYVFQSCGFKIKSGEMSPKFSLPMIKKERLLPAASKKSFLNSNPSFIQNGERQIGLFIGCMANYAYTSVGFSTLKICKELNISVDLLKDQACCGAPAYFTGDFDSVKVLAKRNIAYFEKALEKLEAIIVPEATCSAMLKVDYEHLFFDEKEWQDRAKMVAKKIFLATEFFDKFTNLGEILEKGGNLGEITYHDPCHARKMQKIYKEPRNLLAKNYKIIEMKDNFSCCGFGGVTMQSENYHLSKSAGLKRAQHIAQTGVNIVGAECSACKMQLDNALNLTKGDEIRCQNPIDLIAKAL